MGDIGKLISFMFLVVVAVVVIVEIAKAFGWVG